MKEENKILDLSIALNNIRTKGIIKDWDKEMSLIELAEAIYDSRGVTSLQRMTFKRSNNKKEGTTEWAFGNNIIITFEGRSIPSELSLWSGATGIKIYPYIEKVVQCYNCFKYGHVSKICRSPRRCVICGEAFHDRCMENNRCINCGLNHRSDDKRCEAYQYNRELKSIMAKCECNIYEAKRIWEEENKRVNNIEFWNTEHLKTNQSIQEDKRTRYNNTSRIAQNCNRVGMLSRQEARDETNDIQKREPKNNVSNNSKLVQILDNENPSEVSIIRELMTLLIDKLSCMSNSTMRREIVTGMMQAVNKLDD